MSHDLPKQPPDLLDVSSWRRDYLHAELHRKDLHTEPIDQFHSWLDDARKCTSILEATAMVLSTASAEGEVSSRIVLLKGYDAHGFRFFTNTESLKARQIASNTSVSLLFYWEAMERQIRINGRAGILPRSETEAYFSSRPRESRLGAWASRQSEVLPERKRLEQALEEVRQRFGEDEVPVPEFWSGYVVTPGSYEFWQGRSSRLHDRFRYEKKSGTWTIARLSP